MFSLKWDQSFRIIFLIVQCSINVGFNFWSNLWIPWHAILQFSARFGHLRTNSKYLHYLQLNMFTELKQRSGIRTRQTEQHRPNRDNKHQSWIITNYFKQDLIISHQTESFCCHYEHITINQTMITSSLFWSNKFNQFPCLASRPDCISLMGI